MSVVLISIPIEFVDVIIPVVEDIKTEDEHKEAIEDLREFHKVSPVENLRSPNSE